MKLLVTGSAGHLGEALVSCLRALGHQVLGLDRLASPFTDVVGSINDAGLVARCMKGVDAVLHTATLHKPHMATHSAQDFVQTNIAGTLTLLEAAVAARVGAFLYTSTTSGFGAALTPAAGEGAAWITEDVVPVPRNIYGTSKVAAEDLCQMVQRRHGLPCLVLRTSRFFAEIDDDPALRGRYADANIKANELLYRRVDLQDVVDAHVLAIEKAPTIGFARYIVSATTPFRHEQLAVLRSEAPAVLREVLPGYEAVYAQQGWRMFDGIDRVYVNTKARDELGWTPRHDFAHVIACLERGEDFRSPLARTVGSKRYHAQHFEDGPYPVQP